jgi:hypothetical protein
MKQITRRGLIAAGALSVLGAGAFKLLKVPGTAAKAYLPSPKIQAMPINQISGVLIDWKARAKATYDLLFDFKAKGPFLPVIWDDTERRNYDFDMFALPAYLGDYRQNIEHMGSHESLSGVGAVLGASLAGIDMRSYNGRNLVTECLGYHQQNRVAKILFNQTADSGSESSFWYMIYPNIAFYAINSIYPDEPNFDKVSKDIANEFVEMLTHLKTIEGKFTFEFAGYNFLNKEGVYGGHREPDAAAGVASDGHVPASRRVQQRGRLVPRLHFGGEVRQCGRAPERLAAQVERMRPKHQGQEQDSAATSGNKSGPAW